MNQDEAPIRMQRHVKHPRLRGRHGVAVADDVEENAGEVERKESAEQQRQRRQ